MKKKELEERVADIEGSIMCMECKDHLDSDDYLQLGYLNQELASAKKDLEKWQLRTMRSFFLIVMSIM